MSLNKLQYNEITKRFFLVNGRLYALHDLIKNGGVFIEVNCFKTVEYRFFLFVYDKDDIVYIPNKLDITYYHCLKGRNEIEN